MLAIGSAIRRIHTTVDAPRLTRFALHPPKSVEVGFADGSIFNLSAEFLRVHSPAVDSKIRSIGGEKVISGRRHVGIMSAEPVGNYGVRIVFDDLHKTGIYSWDYFYELGSNKFSFMRNYIKSLKKHGLTRDPRRRK
ncbi:hypothetical protein CFP56_033369 [Quercus suber]|uniref:Gamma-butyrobetaine hydroxylase-like N-terminal domain-containing protein n=1 Tax=Quercus suber TaxID=58331 RepID=A0AAW0LUI7_QUESU